MIPILPGDGRPIGGTKTGTRIRATSRAGSITGISPLPFSERLHRVGPLAEAGRDTGLSNLDPEAKPRDVGENEPAPPAPPPTREDPQVTDARRRRRFAERQRSGRDEGTAQLGRSGDDRANVNQPKAQRLGS